MNNRDVRIRLVSQTTLHDRSYGASVCVCALVISTATRKVVL